MNARNIFKQSYRIFSTLFLTGWMLFSASCSNVQEKLGLIPEEDDARQQLLVALGLLMNSGDYFTKLYYVNPSIMSNLTNSNLIWEAGAAEVTPGKKKLVLVHGWHFDDRDWAGYPSSYALKDRVMAQNWSAFFATSEFNTIVNTKLYDIYAFDYLTSNGVEVNGSRFRAKMDALFSASADNGKVVIYAHSMGGLVTRFALYEGLVSPAYVTRIITTGTPYHGSPWASPQFQENRAVIGSLAGFVTFTTGGQDLRWDNFDGALSGASNPKLTGVNAKTDRDDLMYTYQGNYNNTSQAPGAGAGLALNAACTLLGSTFSPSDCIVPESSAKLQNNPVTIRRSVGSYDHLDVKMGIASIRTQFVTDLP